MRNGFSLWMRQAGERVPERVLQREADDDGADRRGREQLVVEHERGDEGEQADDDGVLQDGREGIRHAVGAERVDEADDDEVDQAGGERELLEANASWSSACNGTSDGLTNSTTWRTR